MAIFHGGALNEVGDREVAPLALQVFRDEPPVTLIGLGFAAQKAPAVQKLRVDLLLDLALLHQREEVALAVRP